MFGSRAAVVVDCTFLATLLAPVVAFISLWLARRGRYEAHRRIQIALLAICILTVLALEVSIRMAGGSGAFLARSGFGRPGLVRAVLAIHVSGAVATYAAWTWLAVASHRRFRGSLPGSFSRRHRRSGRIVIAGLGFTAASAAVMYALAFIV